MDEQVKRDRERKTAEIMSWILPPGVLLQGVRVIREEGKLELLFAGGRTMVVQLDGLEIL